MEGVLFCGFTGVVEGGLGYQSIFISCRAIIQKWRLARAVVLKVGLLGQQNRPHLGTC